MHIFRFATVLFSLFLGAVLAGAQGKPSSDEIPIERCDVLPVVAVKIEGVNYRFLVDTAATTILNIKSFSKGKSKSIEVSSWTGTSATSAREVSLPDLTLGRYTLRGLKLPAVDLSAIGKACGGKIDGILGIDLLDRMGATIDLERRVARLGPSRNPPARHDSTMHTEMMTAMESCVTAFNRGNSAELENCLDTDMVLYTPLGEFRGREQVIGYLRQRYLTVKPIPQFSMKTRDVRVIGDAVLHAYDYSIESPTLRVSGRGVAVCQKKDGHWRMLNMHNSIIQPEPGFGSSTPKPD